MGFLFIEEYGSSVHFDENYIVVICHQEILRKVPIETIEAIYLISSVQVTSQCVIQCLKRGISILYLSKSGYYYGQLRSISHVNVHRQRKQAALYNTKFSLDLAKKIIIGKIHNQEIILKRYAYGKKQEISQNLLTMKQSQKKVKNCKSVKEIMGYEGIAARRYFEGLSKVVDKDFIFYSRSKHPPKDEFNAMLSFGYSMLLTEIYAKLEAKGLHPYFGFIHSDRERHPTLASDIMEEWRAVVIDSLVMGLVNGHEIHKEDFIHDPEKPGYYMTKAGLKIFLRKYDRKLQTTVKYLNYIDYAVTFREAIDLQINMLIKAMELEDASVYQTIWLR